MSEQFKHVSVLLNECIDALDIKPDGIYVDCTAGGGGHSYEIAKRLTTGRLIAIDRDADAIEAAGRRLAEFSSRVTLLKDNFVNLATILNELGISGVDGVLMDLGVSSYQLDCADRGFSYMASAKLDMRMDRAAELDAYTVVNTYSEQELKRILYDFGEEKFAPSIARRIIAARETAPITTTAELAELVRSAVKHSDGPHPEKRTFQAIRIEVNSELSVIEPAIRSAVASLRHGGRLAIITFHSLEDRITKQAFSSLAQGCTCPRDFPVCVCGGKPQIKLISKKPILPSNKECAENSRSHSAKLRVAEKIG
jgi:16S rRNA (cytosine1402-N4)-methyltransferase